MIRSGGLPSESKGGKGLGTLECGVGLVLDSDTGSTSCHGYSGASGGNVKHFCFVAGAELVSLST